MSKKDIKVVKVVQLSLSPTSKYTHTHKWTSFLIQRKRYCLLRLFVQLVGVNLTFISNIETGNHYALINVLLISFIHLVIPKLHVKNKGFTFEAKSGLLNPLYHLSSSNLIELRMYHNTLVKYYINLNFFLFPFLWYRLIVCRHKLSLLVTSLERLLINSWWK